RPPATGGRGSRSAFRTSSTTFAGWRRSNAGGLTRSNWRADWLPLEGGARPPRRKKPAAGSKYAPLHKSCNVRSPIFDEIRHESEVSRRSHRESVILRGPHYEIRPCDPEPNEDPARNKAEAEGDAWTEPKKPKKA